MLLAVLPFGLARLGFALLLGLGLLGAGDLLACAIQVGQHAAFIAGELFGQALALLRGRMLLVAVLLALELAGLGHGREFGAQAAELGFAVLSQLLHFVQAA
ncbi:hypothetical protein D3C85_1699340 [compost metagenome]